jgi:hypothetical protein
MLDDFAAHPETDIFYDKKHEVVEALGRDATDSAKLHEWAMGDGHAMAWANAIVMIVGGQVARYEAHPGAPQEPPTPDEVLRQSDGAMRPDGVYCLRSSLTPRGADPIGGIAAFRYTSPFFIPEKDGNRLLNLTTTNDPRMRDCALALTRTGQSIAMSRIKTVQTAAQEKPMMKPEDAAVMTAAGCAAEDAPEVQMSKLAAYARKMEDDKKSIEAARKMQDPPSVAQTPSNGDAQAALVQRIEALETKNAMLLKELEASRVVSSETQQVMERFRKMEADQKHAAAVDFGGQAVAMGRIMGTHRGDEAKTVEWLAGKYEKDPASAQELLCPEGTFKPSEAQVMQRLTVKGAGIGAPQPVIPVDGVSPLHSAQGELDGHVQIAMERLRTDGTKRTTQQLFDAAERQVSKDKPDLFKRAQGQGV